MKPKKTKPTVQPPRPVPLPAEADKAEQAQFIETLKANRQLAPEGEPLPPGATHQITTDTQGRKRIVRRRFSAI
jgi:hypothetical protein